MNNRLLVAFALIFFQFFSKTVEAQSVQADTLFLKSAITKARAIYLEAFKDQFPLYNGIAYNEVVHGNDRGHPFFLQSNFSNEKIWFDGVLYENIPLIYDVQQDVVVVKLEGTNYKVALVSDKIKKFTLSGHLFERLKSTQIGAPSPAEGFYEALHDGTVRVYCKHLKKVVELNNTWEVRKNYQDKSEYFVYKDGRYWNVERKSTLLNIFDNESAMKEYIKKSKVSFRDKAKFIVLTAEFYEKQFH